MKGKAREEFLRKNRRDEEAFDGFGKADDSSKVFSSGPAVVLMGTAEKYGKGMKWGFDEKGTSALWTMQLVRAERNQIGVELVDGSKGLFAERLNGVGVKEDALFAADVAKLGDRLNSAGFIVSGHDGNQDGVRPNGSGQIVGGD